MCMCKGSKSGCEDEQQGGSKEVLTAGTAAMLVSAIRTATKTLPLLLLLLLVYAQEWTRWAMWTVGQAE